MKKTRFTPEQIRTHVELAAARNPTRVSARTAATTSIEAFKTISGVTICAKIQQTGFWPEARRQFGLERQTNRRDLAPGPLSPLEGT